MSATKSEYEIGKYSEIFMDTDVKYKKIYEKKCSSCHIKNQIPFDILNVLYEFRKLSRTEFIYVVCSTSQCLNRLMEIRTCGKCHKSWFFKVNSQTIMCSYCAK